MLRRLTPLKQLVSLTGDDSDASSDKIFTVSAIVANNDFTFPHRDYRHPPEHHRRRPQIDPRNARPFLATAIDDPELSQILQSRCQLIAETPRRGALFQRSIGPIPRRRFPQVFLCRKSLRIFEVDVNCWPPRVYEESYHSFIPKDPHIRQARSLEARRCAEIGRRFDQFFETTR